ncbi:single-stranded DNA-binding protein [Candidatus Margulisiibacteriota bacterium]
MGFNYNHVTLVGRAIKDPELKQISDNSVKLSFILAVNRSYRKDDGSHETDFVPVTFWGKPAEIGFQLIQKASPVLVWGKIKVRNYEKDNEKKWITEVVGENFQMLERLPNKAEDKEKEKVKTK